MSFEKDKKIYLQYFYMHFYLKQMMTVYSDREHFQNFSL